LPATRVQSTACVCLTQSVLWHPFTKSNPSYSWQFKNPL